MAVWLTCPISFVLYSLNGNRSDYLNKTSNSGKRRESVDNFTFGAVTGVH